MVVVLSLAITVCMASILQLDEELLCVVGLECLHKSLPIYWFCCHVHCGVLAVGYWATDCMLIGKTNCAIA